MKSLNYIAILTLILLFNQCTPENKKVTYHGSINESNASKKVIIEPNQFGSFDALVDRVVQIVCQDSIPTLLVRENFDLKYFGFANYCPANYGCVLIKEQNILNIKDQLIRGYISIDSLEYYTVKHIINQEKSAIFSQSPSKAIFTITYKKNDLSKMEVLINKMIKYHSSLNTEAPLMVILDNKIQIPPPFSD